jgi:glycine/D-amino acid oxidase-like deaminating enzyme
MERTGELYRFSRESLALASKWLDVKPSGGLWVSVMPGEEKDVSDGVAVLENLGIPVEIWPATKVNATLGSRGLGTGRFLPEEMSIDPVAAAQQLCRRAIAAGARVHTLSPFESVEEGSDLRLKIAGRKVRAEAMIFAANAHLQTLDPAFEDTLHPVRFQGLATEPVPPAGGLACRGQHGYLAWRQAPDGALLAGGCRWAVPHMEIGETDDRVVVDLIERKIRDFIERHLPTFAYEAVVQRWSGIMGFSCDGLPLIGPLPGQSRKLVCAGFNGLEPSLAFGAAQAVTRGLLEGGDPGLPDFLRPGRFL